MALMQPVDPGPARARRIRERPVPATAAAVARTTVTPPVTPIGLARRSPRRALLALARPRQWVKNALVIGAPGAGGVAAPVGLSRWFVVVVTCVAVFVAAGKRLAELIRASGRGGAARPVLRLYTRDVLSRLLALAGAGALFAYSVWAFELPDIDG